MFCTKCGVEIGTSKFCYNCGSENVVESVSEIVDSFQYDTKINSLKEFYKKYASSSTKGWHICLIVLCFFNVLICVVNLFQGNIFALIDAVVFLSVGICLLIDKKWIPALVAAIYFTINTIIMLILTSSLKGWLCIIASIMVAKNLYKINSAYNSYLSSNILPENEI